MREQPDSGTNSKVESDKTQEVERLKEQSSKIKEKIA